MLSNDNERSELDYKMWVVDGECTPQAAASLILGLDPYDCIVNSESDWRAVTILVDEVQQVCDALCGGRPWWSYKSLTIFNHVNTAIKNRIKIADGLLTEIAEYFANCIGEDREQFINRYPYLARELNQPIEPKVKQEPQTLITEKERPQVLQIMLGMAMHGYGYKPGATKNTATGNNKGSIRAALQSVGLDVTDDTIRKYLNEGFEMFPDVKPHKT